MDLVDFSKRKIISHIKKIFSDIGGELKRCDEEIYTKLKSIGEYKYRMSKEGILRFSP
jgi:hypothetical protein